MKVFGNPVNSALVRRTRTGMLSYLSLFTSLSTLLCCALPSLLVLFGLGASVASMLSFLPWLVTLSHHKRWTFVLSGLLIGQENQVVRAFRQSGLRLSGRRTRREWLRLDFRRR